MSVSVTLPQMGESVTEGTIIKWLKAEGDTVTEDEPLVEISTDKIDTELPSPASGVLSKIIVAEDQTVDVGSELAVIEADGAAVATEQKAEAAPAAEPPAPAKKADPAVAPAKAEKAAPPSPPRAPAAPAAPAAAAKPRATGTAKATSPLVRKLARDLGIDVSTLAGSGTGGRVTKDDVITAARTSGPPRSTTGPDARALDPSRFTVPSDKHEDVSFDRIRKAIAEHMIRSRATAAHVTDVIEVDMTSIANVRERAKTPFKKREGTSLTFMPFIAAATVQALRAYPEFNAHILEDGSTARLFNEVNLGIAVGRDEGLIVPVVHGAEGLNLRGLARAIADVGERARTRGGLTPADVTGGTFTITNYGSFGAIMDTPIINQPQVAILGVGAVVKRPAVIEVDGVDAIAIRHLMMLSLSYDHRWIDGHQAARFNATLKRILESADLAAELS